MLPLQAITVGELFSDYTNLAITAANLVLYIGGAAGIYMVVNGLMKLRDPNPNIEQGRIWVSVFVGGLMTCVGVIAGALTFLITG